ncbi:hypothetical protein J6590_075695 [Homalodisca vitripennis]|nr:hypothetical protein J6590_075695 [Homalodisca vitripennis]
MKGTYSIYLGQNMLLMCHVLPLANHKKIEHLVFKRILRQEVVALIPPGCRLGVLHSSPALRIAFSTS